MAKSQRKQARRSSSPRSAQKALPAAVRHLLIVESPAKARTIGRYLGADYHVEATLGHVKDLPEHGLGVDVEHGFQPRYTIIPGRRQVLQRLRELARRSEDILLATDPDREGEAIAWHIAEELQGVNSNVRRVLFYEITRSGVQQGIAQPRELNRALVLSQQARRVMDRLIGYQVSPWLSDVLVHEVPHALSAGRVQSVALRLICEREEQIRSFEPIPYWTIRAEFELPSGERFWAELVEYGGRPLRTPEGSARALSAEQLERFHYVRSAEEAEALLQKLRQQTEWTVERLQRKRVRRMPPPPFQTSLLQQEAARRLRFSPQKTMRLAQQLYEGVPLGTEGPVGLITYMRTDSLRVSHEAQQAARRWIAERYGAEYLPEEPPEYSSRSAHVQDAHEAIRPTHLEYAPERVAAELESDLAALYELIYLRFLASQMAPAELAVTTVWIRSGEFLFRASGSVVLFEGFLRAYQEAEEEGEDADAEREERQRLPEQLAQGMLLRLRELQTKASQTRPPARYTEATLIKELDTLGIGRPSTYATIVSTLFERKYVQRQRRQLVPTELGEKVNRILVQYFPDIFAVDFTARMEQQLDAIAEGEQRYEEVLELFYRPFHEALQRARQMLPSAVQCPECGAPMVVKLSRQGRRFLSCSRYPECKGAMPIPRPAPEVHEEVRCPLCGAPMVRRQGEYGDFYGCSRYPECKGVRPISSGVRCPECGSGELVERRDRKGRRFWGCSRYPECSFLTRYRPIPQPCPKCAAPYLEERGRWSDGQWTTSWRCPACGEEFVPGESTAEEVAPAAPNERGTPAV
jgi:DNA topoisomerase-1